MSRPSPRRLRSTCSSGRRRCSLSTRRRRGSRSGEVFRTPWLPVPIYSYGVMLGTVDDDRLVPGHESWPSRTASARSRRRHLHVDGDLVHRRRAPSLRPRPTSTTFDSAVDIFKVWNGGLVAYGGMIGGFLASWYGCHKRKIPLFAGRTSRRRRWCWERPSPASVVCCSAAILSHVRRARAVTFPKAAAPRGATLTVYSPAGYYAAIAARPPDEVDQMPRLFRF